MRGIIIGDSLYEAPRTKISRTYGAHRIATLMRARGVEVEVLDFFNDWSEQELNQALTSYSVDFLGLSLGLGKLDEKKTNYFITLAKKLNPNLKVIVGGGTALTLTENYNYIAVDLYFKGFADGAIDDIISYLSTGEYPSPIIKTVNGYNDIRKVVDCNHHYSKFSLTNLRTQYTENDFLTSREHLSLETSRGCIFKCRFCNSQLLGKNKNDYIRDKEDIKNEIIDNYNRWGIKKYIITDDTFNDNELKVDMLYEISQEIDFDLSFMGYVRVDLLKAKPGSLDKLVKAGFKGMHFGIETLSLNTSKSIGKGFSGEPLKEYLREIKQSYPNLHLTGSFIVGLPYESAEQAEANIHWSIDEKLIDSTPLFHLSIYKENVGEFSDLSEFSRTWPNYGYEELTDDEISELFKQPKYNEFTDIDINKMRRHEIIWKNSEMNIFDAILSVKKLKLEIHGKSNINGWHSIATSYSKHSVDELMNMKILEWDWDYIKHNTADFIINYKNKKLAALKNSK